MTVGFAVPTRGRHEHLDRLVELYSQFGQVLILEKSNRREERYASWVNQAIQWCKDEQHDVLVFTNDDILPNTEAIVALISAIKNGADIASQNRWDNNWDFSADFFALRIGPDQLWMDESFGFHWADLDMALRGRFMGKSHALLDIEYDVSAYKPIEPKGHLSEFGHFARADEELRDARWGWLLNREVKHP